MKRGMIILILLILGAFSMSCACAGDADSSPIEAAQIDELTAGDDGLAVEQGSNDEALNAETDSIILSAGEGNYSDLRNDIENGGDLTKSYYRYLDGDGETIDIATPDMTVNGNGAVIDMNGSDIRALKVSASGVTIKNLTIKNVNYGGGSGGAIYFIDSVFYGRVESCNFINNKAATSMIIYGGGAGGAVYMYSGAVSNCNFINNSASYGGAVYFNNGTLSNCNFTDNSASTDSGGAVYFNNGTLSNCNFAGNHAETYGGAVFFDKDGKVINCNFTKNWSYNGEGGAINFNDFECGSELINCNFIGNEIINDDYAGAVFMYFGTIKGCNFTNNSAESGGAVASGIHCNVTNCNFDDNKAIFEGAAIWVYSTCRVTNCNFNNNRGTTWGGAIRFASGSVENCSFTNNTAEHGGAVEFDGEGSLKNCYFADNKASEGGAVYSNSPECAADSCIFKTQSDTINSNVIVVAPTIYVENFKAAYGSGEKVTFDLKTKGGMPLNGRNILIEVYYEDSGIPFGNYSCLSDEGWTVVLPVGSYYAVYGTEFEEFEPVRRTVTVSKADSDVDVSDVIMYYGTSVSLTVTTEGATAITAKINDINATVMGNTIMLSPDAGTYMLAVTTIPDSNHIAVTKTSRITVNKLNTQLTADSMTVIYNVGGDLTVSLKDALGNPLANQILLVDLNGAKTFDLTDLNGTIKVPVKGLEANNYSAEIVFMGNDNYNGSNATAEVTVNRDSTSLSGDAVTAVYNVNKNLVITLKDSLGNPIRGAAVAVDLNGVRTFTTDANGQVQIATGSLIPKAYTAKITFNGDNNYLKSTADVDVAVKKATPKLTAKAKTFKRIVKVKKYAVTLKDNLNKVLKDTKVVIKVKKKTYTAKTNAKGKATFKIKKLTKKGTYKATVTFNGNAYYDKVTKKVKIKVR